MAKMAPTFSYKTEEFVPKGGFSNSWSLVSAHTHKRKRRQVRGFCATHTEMAKEEADNCRTQRSALGGAISSGTQWRPRPEISPLSGRVSYIRADRARKRTFKEYSERPLWKQMLGENAGCQGEPTLLPASASSLPGEPSPGTRLRPPHPFLEKLGGTLRNRKTGQVTFPRRPNIYI